MAFLNDYATRLNYTSKSESESIKAGIIKSFKNPSYALVEVIEPDGTVDLREINTTATKDGKEQLILSHPDQSWISGTVVLNLRGVDYLVTQIANVGEINQEIKIVKLNKTIKWMTPQGVLEHRVSVYSKGGDASWDKFFAVPSGTALAMLPQNTLTQTISLNKRFFVGSMPYKVIRLDDFSLDGVVILTLQEDAITSGDINGVCDYQVITPIGLISLAGKTEIRATTKAIYYLMEEGVTSALTPVVWSIDNPDISKISYVEYADRIEITALQNAYGFEFNLTGTMGAKTATKTIKIISLL